MRWRLAEQVGCNLSAYQFINLTSIGDVVRERAVVIYRALKASVMKKIILFGCSAGLIWIVLVQQSLVWPLFGFTVKKYFV